MGQDYLARKQAKKQRKQLGRDGRPAGKRKRKDDGLDIAAVDDDGLQLTAEQQKRKRKKGNNVSLRISRSLCYTEPKLTADDLAGDWEDDAGAAGGSSVLKTHTFAEAGYDSDVDKQLSKLPKEQWQPGSQAAKQNKQHQQQKSKLSTGVNLLDPAKAAKPNHKRQQQRQRQQQLDDVINASDALKQLHQLHPLLARCMAKLGFIEATPIQQTVWPEAFAGKDVQGLAEPGSGKTLAYLLPALVCTADAATAGSYTTAAGSGGNQLLADATGSSMKFGAELVEPRVLVLTPSRELAEQVHGQCAALYAVTHASCCLVCGGMSKDQQIQQLQQQRPQVLVATPGRLLDHIDSGVLGLKQVLVVVLDEADKMLSVGFEPQLSRLKGLLIDNRVQAAVQQQEPAAPSAADAGNSKVQKLRHKMRKQPEGSSAAACAVASTSSGAATAAGSQHVPPQVLLFTATLPEAVQQTAATWLKPGAAHTTVKIGADAISKTITQVVHICAEHKKPAKLLKHLAAIKEASAGMRNPPRVLVFANKIKTVVFVHKTVSEAGYRAALLHGKRSQPERQAAVADFRAGKLQVLVASDVASRGLDIRGLPYVVNYDFPSNLETYIHRVGRTGRLAAHGHAYSFFTRSLARLAPSLVKLLQAHDQSLDPNLLQLAEAWQQVVKTLKAQGKPEPQPEGADGDEDEDAADTSPAGLNGQQGLMSPVPLPEDLQEGLTQLQQHQQAAGANKALHDEQQINRKKRKASKQARDVLLLPQAAAAAAAPDGYTGGSTGVPDFIPSAWFIGAKPGMVFKTGSCGLGYHADALAAAAAVAAAAKHGMPSLQQHHQCKQQAGTQSKPSKQSKQQQQQGTKLNSGDKLPPLPGLARKQQRNSGNFSDGDSSSSSGGNDRYCDSEGAGAGAGFQDRLSRKDGGKKKALPGRLRKKLATQKAKAGGAGKKK